jgi:hypothetical protein
MWGGLLQDTVSPMGDMVHSYFDVSSGMKPAKLLQKKS